MKQVIKGKVYDTEKSGRVGTFNENSGPIWTQFTEVLYKKRTGEFFIYGAGGPSSKYGKLASKSYNEWRGSEEIIPLSYEAAREWAEEHLTESEYNSVFGAITENDKRTLVTLSMSLTVIEKAKRAASQAGMSLSAYIESLVIQ